MRSWNGMSQPESQHAGLELRHESWTAPIADCWRSELIAQPFTAVAKRYGLAMRVKACKLVSTSWVLHLLDMPCTVARRLC